MITIIQQSKKTPDFRGLWLLKVQIAPSPIFSSLALSSSLKSKIRISHFNQL
jgi:hypothetical protein